MAVNCCVFDEIFAGKFTGKFIFWDECVILARLDNSLLWSGCVTSLLFEDALEFIQNLLDKGVLTNAWWTNYDEWLLFLWCWVKWMEIFFGVNKYIILYEFKIDFVSYN